MKCSRCDSPDGTDVCAECYLSLCLECTDDGCCGVAPARVVMGLHFVGEPPEAELGELDDEGPGPGGVPW